MQITLEDIPADFADYLNITEASAQVLLSIVVILAILLPVMLLSHKRSGFTLELITIFLTECLLVGIGWLPFWLLIMTVCIIAIGVAGLGRDLIFGSG